MIVPNTDVYLIKSPLEVDQLNQLTFSNATAQYNYFQSLPKLYLEDGTYSYQRKDGVMRVGALIDDIQTYNYVMYKNTNHSSKWFYAFITGMEYLNDNVTAVSIKTDVFQTWQFDLTYKRTFVEREHVSDDTMGKHTIPEGLETGEYIQNGTSAISNIVPSSSFKDSDNHTVSPAQGHMIVFQVSYLINAIRPDYPNTAGGYNGIFSGLYYFACKSFTDALDIIRQYDNEGRGGDIVAIFMAPAKLFSGASYMSAGTTTIYIPSPTLALNSLLTSDTTIAAPTTIDSYTPVNKKCLCYPYSYMYVTNNAGIDTDFRYEDFSNNTANFTVNGALGQGCSIRLMPYNYKTSNTNGSYEFGIAGAKYPVCAWKSDYYTNWVTQNAVNIAGGVATDVAKAGLGFAAGAAFGNPMGMASAGLGLLGSITSTIGQSYAASKHPNYANGNLSNADTIIGAGKYFTVIKMCVRAEVIQVVDHYFSMFGYKVNEVKIPNITGRRNWNYVKTIGCYIDADIPQEDLQEIKSMFDKGITFWHNPTTFMDYSQNNDII